MIITSKKMPSKTRGPQDIFDILKNNLKKKKIELDNLIQNILDSESLYAKEKKK